MNDVRRRSAANAKKELCTLAKELGKLALSEMDVGLDLPLSETARDRLIAICTAAADKLIAQSDKHAELEKSVSDYIKTGVAPANADALVASVATPICALVAIELDAMLAEEGVHAAMCAPVKTCVEGIVTGSSGEFVRAVLEAVRKALASDATPSFSQVLKEVDGQSVRKRSMALAMKELVELAKKLWKLALNEIDVEECGVAAELPI